MPLEAKLEQLILQDPEILEAKLLLLGNQVPTTYGKYVDLLGVDSEGVLHILELKRDRTPREVVAQTLDYASWVRTLGNSDVRDIFENNNPVRSFDEAFAERFDGAPVPDELNSGHVMTIIASDLDPATERIIEYLNTSHGVPINAMLFRYFTDNGHEYLARTWLIDAGPVAASGTTQNKSTRAPWNGSDWYVAFGVGESRSWDDARSYGFISAGGADWYSRTMKSLPAEARVFVHVPQHGYVGVGIVQGPAVPADEAVLDIDGVSKDFRSLTLQASYLHPQASQGVDAAEYIVPVQWVYTVALEDAVWRQGMFANQNSACKLRNQFTIDELTKEFKLDALPRSGSASLPRD
ncbi:endonuclease NucS domain-containing protein [Arthrobacter jinronghuae]|uniref:endonuclease NucS domain-containing protein n=1 Tax=Arthrobacter jinronghuae TaxID=2964609 RepID=UPI002A4E124B|nr:endonuclease NucS domain-containing protein [Arthrobacter jinronghuae]